MSFKLFEVVLILFRLSSLLRFVSFGLFLVFVGCTCRLNCLRAFWVFFRLMSVVSCCFMFLWVPKNCLGLFQALNIFRLFLVAHFVYFGLV